MLGAEKGGYPWAGMRVGHYAGSWGKWCWKWQHSLDTSLHNSEGTGVFVVSSALQIKKLVSKRESDSAVAGLAEELDRPGGGVPSWLLHSITENWGLQ